MSRVEPGRYVLMTIADRNAVAEALGHPSLDAVDADLRARIRYGAFHDVHDEEWARGDVEAMLTVWREQQLNESELADLLTTALLVTGGLLGANEATRRIRDVVEARSARRRREARSARRRREAEESARLTLDTAEAEGTGITS